MLVLVTLGHLINNNNYIISKIIIFIINEAKRKHIKKKYQCHSLIQSINTFSKKNLITVLDKQIT